MGLAARKADYKLGCMNRSRDSRGREVNLIYSAFVRSYSKYSLFSQGATKVLELEHTLCEDRQREQCVFSQENGRLWGQQKVADSDSKRKLSGRWSWAFLQQWVEGG